MPLAFSSLLKCQPMINLYFSLWELAIFLGRKDLIAACMTSRCNLLALTPVWLTSWVSKRWMKVREEGASFSTTTEHTGAVTRCWKEFGNRSRGGCWWQPELKPAVWKLDNSANPTVTPAQLWNHHHRPTPGHALPVPAVMLWFTLLRCPRRRWSPQHVAMLSLPCDWIPSRPLASPVYPPMGPTGKMKVLFAFACVRSCSQAECQAAESATAAWRCAEKVAVNNRLFTVFGSCLLRCYFKPYFEKRLLRISRCKARLLLCVVHVEISISAGLHWIP